MAGIRNFNKNMQYRRFGKTNKELSVITLGGMRYATTGDEPRDIIPKEMISQCADIVRRSFAAGINHIETAHGYGRSEHCYGKVLSEEIDTPRSNYFIMTKGAPSTAAEVRPLIEGQLKALKTDHIDFYGWHGINNREKFEMAVASGGPVMELIKLRDEGIIGHVGFSTHGGLDVILDSIDTGLFDFVNLHYYYFFQRNLKAILNAASRDMGVFIISPNDKGGQLFNAPMVLRNLTAPLTPIQWNARYCLKTPMVHTLTFGMTEASHIDEMVGIAQEWAGWGDSENMILENLDKRKDLDPYSTFDAYSLKDLESGINIPEILRFRTMWKCFDMVDWCQYRYNMFQEKGDWFPGFYATGDRVALIHDKDIPAGIPLKEMLTEFHDAFYAKR